MSSINKVTDQYIWHKNLSSSFSNHLINMRRDLREIVDQTQSSVSVDMAYQSYVVDNFL